ncbi:MAG TPA: MFS transporter [Motilibacteraceae bacterium]|nr:MFS transporter [Motilibacteraceae bacterium]
MSRRRGLVGLFVAQAVSTTGTRMSLLALPVFVFLTTGSALRTGLVGFAEMLPYVLLKLFGGPLVDRLGPWRASVGSDLAAAVVVGTVPLLHALHTLSFPLLLALVALAGALRAPGDGAKSVLLPAVVARAAVPMERAVGLSDGVSRLATMLGAPLGGALVGVLGAPWVLVIDAASFAVGAVVVGCLVERAEVLPAKARSSGLRAYAEQMREGFSFLRGQPFLRAAAGMVAVTNLLDAAVTAVLLPVWALTRYGDQHGPAALGLVMAVFGAGAVAGTAVMAGVGHRLPRRLTYATAFLLGGAPRILVLALPVPLVVVVAVSAVCGLAGGAINPLLAAAEYERIPAALQARVLGAVGGLAWAGIPLGGLLGGWTVGGLGLPIAVVVVGGLYLAATLDPFLRPAWRDMERRPLQADDAGDIAPSLQPDRNQLTVAAGTVESATSRTRG